MTVPMASTEVRRAQMEKAFKSMRRAAWWMGGVMSLSSTAVLLLCIFILRPLGWSTEFTGWVSGFAIPFAMILWFVFASLFAKARLIVPWWWLYLAILLIFLWALVARGV